jgi:hypothetical protein
MNEDTPTKERDPGKVTGAVLILIGLVLFILQMSTGVTVSIMLLVGGAAFIIGYLSRRTYGFLVPGCILAGMGLGQLGEEYIGFIHNPNFVGLGIGFLAIFVIDKLYRGSTNWWPLIPGCILLFMGLETSQLNMGTLLSKGWPLALVIIGILYVTGKIGSHRGGGHH